MSAPIAGNPPTAPVPVEPAPVAPPEPAGDWRLQLTDADRPLILALAVEHHARRRPLHREARDLQHRIEGTTHA